MLQLDRSKFYRVKSGQSAREIEKVLCVPVNNCYEGAIINVLDCSLYTVQPFETYASIAQRYGMEEEQLKEFNGARPLYPTCKIFIPTHVFHS